MVSQKQIDKIQNALICGMALEDAYIYAGLTASEIAEIMEDEEQQLSFRRTTKELEYSLLDKLQQVADKQIRMGKEGALTWMLEKMFPRYSNKPQDIAPTININSVPYDPSTVTVSVPDEHPVDEAPSE